MKQQTTRPGPTFRLPVDGPEEGTPPATTPSSGAGGVALDISNAVMEGADVLESRAVKLGATQLYNRINNVLATQGRVLVLVEFPRTNPWIDAVKQVFEVELREGGTVHGINLETRGRELQRIHPEAELIYPFESVDMTWS